MRDQIDPTEIVGLRARFEIAPGRYRDIAVGVPDTSYAIARGRELVNQDNTHAFPELTPLTQAMCDEIGLQPGEVRELKQA